MQKKVMSMECLGYYFSDNDPASNNQRAIPVFKGPYHSFKEAKINARKYYQQRYKPGSYNYYTFEVCENNSFDRTVDRFKYEHFYINFLLNYKQSDYFSSLYQYKWDNNEWNNGLRYNNLLESRCTIRNEEYQVPEMIEDYLQNLHFKEKDIFESCWSSTDVTIVSAQLNDDRKILKHILVCNDRVDYARGEFLCTSEPQIKQLLHQSNDSSLYCYHCMRRYAGYLNEELTAEEMAHYEL